MIFLQCGAQRGHANWVFAQSATASWRDDANLEQFRMLRRLILPIATETAA